MPNKKESLSIIAVKAFLAVIIFVGVGTIIIWGGYLITKKLAEIKVSENKIMWVVYDSSSKSLFDWENYNLQYPSSWHYTEERISSSRKLGVLKTNFVHKNTQPNALSITVGNDKSDSLLIQDAAEVRLSNNIFYKYNGNRTETRQAYYIYKTGTDEEINFGMEVEIIFEFNNTNENIIKEILESFTLQPTVKSVPIIKDEAADWQIYQNEEYGYEIKYLANAVEIVLDDVFERGTEGNPGFRIKSGGHFALGVWENQKKLTAKQWIDKQYAEYSGGWIWDFNETTIGTEKAFSALRTDMCYIEWVIIPKLGYFYTFGMEICEDNKSASLETFNQILSTFKFIEK